ncbi:uncharacterized protein LOC110842241 [Folsomia candida]|uniref:uncharacterized protein LOC110842241 n=1 Tax=Folsomia candida TaxID=158441 RepID=UPI000B900727|nr:uncharacterized protein LOC110842241 [Folsomia candida]XP_035707267.1 uncharacterized protein LOC110842241 [Folsomia candida]
MSTLTGEAGSSATKGDQSVINQSGGSQPPNPSGHHHHHVQATEVIHGGIQIESRSFHDTDLGGTEGKGVVCCKGVYIGVGAVFGTILLACVIILIFFIVRSTT